MRRLFIMRKDLGMSPGKLAAQVGHCAEAYWLHRIRDVGTSLGLVQTVDWKRYEKTAVLTPLDIYTDYVCASFVKTVCEAKNSSHLRKAAEKAKELGLTEGEDFGFVYDNCLTELEPEEENGTTLTGIWFRPLPDDVAHEISRKYQLYK